MQLQQLVIPSSLLPPAQVARIQEAFKLMESVGKFVMPPNPPSFDLLSHIR